MSFADEPLAQHSVTYQPNRHHLATVVELERFETPYQSVQPPLWELDAGDWLTVVRVSPYAPRRPRSSGGAVQPCLLAEDLVADAAS